MAAYAALVSVMQIIHQIEDHPFPPISIHTHQLQSLTQIITSLQKFLEGYNSPVADSDEDDPLEMRIADAAYAAEDVIESYIVHKIKLARSTTTHDDDDDDQEAGSGEESSTSSSGEENADSSTISSSGEEPSFYEDLHQVIEDMNMIKKEVEFRNDQLPAASAGASTTSSSSSTMQNSSMVGFDDVSREVFFKLTDGGRGRQVIPVVGMGGIGKTTLVRNIYAKKVIKKNFHICAWVTVSKKRDSKEILCEILSQASGESKEQLSKMSEEKLKLQLHQYLFGRRYLIVLDDIWSVDAWDSTRLYFPENNKGSRVVVTTRLSSLGSELDNSNSVQMKFLDEGFSWELFTKTVFGERGCPPELEEIGKKIAENCRGLPLSIVVVGGFLKNMEHTQKIWRSVWDNLTSIVMLENDKHCLKLLKTSYNHLPVYLKPCFLYLGLFEEDDEISVKTLIRLWVSEGFVRPRNGQSLETIALGFIKELDDRNLIIVDEWGCTGNIKGFKIHDLLMDLCSREGQTQRFYHVIRHKRRHHRRRRHPHRFRRLLIDDTTSNEEAHEALQSMPLVRSIICEENDKVLACQNLGLLRILNEYTSHEDESRVVVTTRSSNLGSELNSNSVKMKLLDETFSWELFTKTVFGDRGCHPELEEIGKKISENCRGLPLSIVVVGGFLKKKEHTQQIWRSVLDDLTSTVMLENDEHCLKLLKKSYNHLPVHLKPCFLYLGLFEEDDEISVKTLIRLWVAEGFVRPRNGQSLETIALGFIKELDDRNLIIVDEWGCTGNIKSFKMHDLLMDLCSREGQTQRFYHVIRHNGLDHPHGCRRLLIDDTTSNEEAHEALKPMSLVRSIICEENDKVLPCQNLGLLRILNEHTNHMDESDGSPMVFQFVNLRHAIVEVHSNLSITHLWNLQTLIVYAYESLQVPIEIWRMRQLRHIEFVEAQLQHLPDPPVDNEVVVMENLQTLKGVENLKLGEEVIKRIPNIKRLLIENDHGVERAGDDYYCVSNIERLRKLESLTYQEKHGRVHNLTNLKFPNSIKKLTLRTSYDDDMMGKIGSLPLLQKLKLLSGSFRTGEWEIGQNQFKNLRSLTLFWCNGLKHWTTAARMASPVFPTLERLRLSRLTQLNLQIPSEIGNGAMLKSIELSFCSKTAVKSARRILDDQLKHQDEEDLGLHVVVMVDKKHKKLESLASRNFEVEVYEHS